MGTEIIKGVNDNYNTILMDQGVVTVNTEIQANPFMDPNIFLSNEVNPKENAPEMANLNNMTIFNIHKRLKTC